MYRHRRMTSLMSGEWKASKKTHEKTTQGDTPGTLVRNTKDIRRASTESERRQKPEADTWVCVMKERDRKSIRKQATDMKGLKGICWWRDRGVKRRASVPGLRFTIWEWLSSGWRSAIIPYQLGSGAVNSGMYTLSSVDTHTCTQACWVISLPRAGSAHSLYCSGVQYGASPEDRQRKHNVLSLNKKSGQGRKRISKKHKWSRDLGL